ncbi:MAG: arginine repressor [Gammaproteobacteria bacterium]|nr:arginine repressor [Gammaproteobacteria bacterium]
MMSEKQVRQTAIKELIANHIIPNQEKLVELLLERNIKATQTTLSRDLNELGIWKGPEGYVLGNEAAPVRATKNELKKVLQTLLVSAEVASNMLVLKTQPGRAQAIGYELDNIKLPLVVGNISGDDTVFIATRSEEDAMQLKREIENLI